MSLRTRWLLSLLLFGLWLPLTASHAQTDSLPAEPDSDAFIAANFHLQDTYNAVQCVAQNGDCPTEISVAVPCLTSACVPTPQTYSIANTFTTIQDAANNAQPGDLIIIMPGRYRGVQIEETGGADGAYIHFLGWGEPGSVIVDSSADPSKSFLRHHFYFISAHHYIVQNIAFENASEGAGVFFSGFFSETGQFSHHIIVSDIYSHDNYSWGLHTTSTSYMLIQDSAFTHSQDEHGAYISGSGDNMVIRRNVFQGNIAAGLQINADPQTATAELFYWLDNSTGDTCGWTEDDVDFTGAATWDDLKACYDQQGLPDLGEFIEDGISENIIVEQNIITANGDSGGAGINLASVRHSTIRNNLIYGNFAAGIACWDNAYAEEKSLDSSQFGCQDVHIVNNTLVDESGGRGSLILNNDARDMQVFNNIIIRDRFDAYEIANRSGQDLRSGHNYYSNRSEDNAPSATAEANSITGFSVADGLSQFVAPGFAPWINEGEWFTLNPDRPDYHLGRDSNLLTAGAAEFAPTLDLNGNPRTGTEIGALSGGSEVSPPPDTSSQANESPPTSPATGSGVVTYLLPDGHLYRLSVDGDSPPEDISARLDAVAPGVDGWLNISPDGQWLLMSTERFDPECNGWSCLALLPADLSTYEVIRANGNVIHDDSFSAIASGGNLIAYTATDGPHTNDLYATERSGADWSAPITLTETSPYEYNYQPAISADGQHVVFICGDEPYGDTGTALCEAATDGSSLRVVLTPADGPPDSPVGSAIYYSDYAPDGSIIFEGDWGGELIWRLTPDETDWAIITDAYNNDNTPCVLSDGRIVSLWLDRPDGQGFHEIKIMNPDGSQGRMLLVDQDVIDGGLGCGG